jgi:hypothetical protein
MATQQSDAQVESKEPFPANENSTYPPKSTIRIIVSLTLGIAVLVMLFALSSNHPGHKADAPMPASQQQASPAGAHDQQ